MNIHLKAAIYTLGMLAAVVTGACVVIALSVFGGVDPTTIFALLLMVFGIYTIYQLMLNKLKYDQELDAINDRIQERK